MLYTCDACHYTFPAEEYNMFLERSTVDRCPDCGKATVTAKITINGRERLTSSPAVRPAIEEEIASYERLKKEIEEEDRITLTATEVQ